MNANRYDQMYACLSAITENYPAQPNPAAVAEGHFLVKQIDKQARSPAPVILWIALTAGVIGNIIAMWLP